MVKCLIMLSNREITCFWAGYIVQLRNINVLTKRNNKYNDEIMEELLSALCDMYNVDKAILDDLDYEYAKKVPLQLILKKLEDN
jgi:hypothetical protein